jgi:hypothetical protein
LQTIMQSTPLTRPMPAIEAGAGRVVVVQVQRGQRREFEERRAGVEQHLHAVARQQLAAPGVPAARATSPPPSATLASLDVEVLTSARMACSVGLEVGGSGVEFGLQNGHVHPLVVALHHGARGQA